MLKARFALLGLVPALALAACGLESRDEPAAAEVEQSLSAQPELVGTFKSDRFLIGELAVLVVKTDNTFHLAQFVTCITTPCDPVPLDGTYRLLQRNGIRFISLYDSAGTLLYRYQYVLKGDTLSLRLHSTGDDTWHTMQHSEPAWCAAPPDCSLQELPPGPCAGSWSCEKNECSYQCRPIASEIFRGVGE